MRARGGQRECAALRDTHICGQCTPHCAEALQAAAPGLGRHYVECRGRRAEDRSMRMCAVCQPRTCAQHTRRRSCSGLATRTHAAHPQISCKAAALSASAAQQAAQRSSLSRVPAAWNRCSMMSGQNGKVPCIHTLERFCAQAMYLLMQPTIAAGAAQDRTLPAAGLGCQAHSSQGQPGRARAH